jgi:hypothetical protein
MSAQRSSKKGTLGWAGGFLCAAIAAQELLHAPFNSAIAIALLFSAGIELGRYYEKRESERTQRDKVKGSVRTINNSSNTMT